MIFPVCFYLFTSSKTVLYVPSHTCQTLTVTKSQLWNWVCYFWGKLCLWKCSGDKLSSSCLVAVPTSISHHIFVREVQTVLIFKWMNKPWLRGYDQCQMMLVVAKPALDWQSSCATQRCSLHHCPFCFPGLSLPCSCLPALMTVRSFHKMLDYPVQWKTIHTGFTGLVLYCCRKIEAAHRVVQCFLVTAWDVRKHIAGSRKEMFPFNNLQLSIWLAVTQNGTEFSRLAHSLLGFASL